METFFLNIDKIIFRTHFDDIHLINEDGESFDEIVPENRYPEKYRDALINVTSDQPLVYTDYPDSSRIKTIAENFPENFIVTKEMIINTAIFRAEIEEYLRDIIDDALGLEQYTLSLNIILNELRMSLENKYFPWDKFLEDEILKNIELFGKFPHTDTLTKKPYKLDLKVEIGKGLRSGEILYEQSTLNLKPMTTLPIDRALKKVFLTLSKKEIGISRVYRELFKLPEMIEELKGEDKDNNFGSLIASIKKLGDFSYSEKNETVALQDEKYKEVYKQLSDTTKTKIAEPSPQYSSDSKSGVFSLLFTGEKFIIPNAVQYVEVRPLLYFGVSDDLTVFTQNYYNPLPDFWNQSHYIIYSFLYDAKNETLDKYQLVKEWLAKFTIPRLYYCDKEAALKLKEELIWAYPTVLNYKDNPGNPAKYSIEKQLRILHGKE